MKQIFAQRKNAYFNLCQRVKVIDPEAETYLRVKAIKLLDFVYCGILSGAFGWSTTPQGADFWRNIDLQLTKTKKD